MNLDCKGFGSLEYSTVESRAFRVSVVPRLASLANHSKAPKLLNTYMYVHTKSPIIHDYETLSSRPSKILRLLQNGFAKLFSPCLHPPSSSMQCIGGIGSFESDAAITI